MSERKISVSLTFDFYPDGEHEDLFEEMTEDEIVRSALGMAVEDAQRAEARMFDVVVTSE
jgi:hypothetical protein